MANSVLVPLPVHMQGNLNIWLPRSHAALLLSNCCLCLALHSAALLLVAVFAIAVGCLIAQCKAQDATVSDPSLPASTTSPNVGGLLG